MTNILLLEDDETIAFGIQKALEKKGYHLLLCSCIEEAGGDDYITKPFHLSVLESRIHAVLRRTANPQNTRHSLLTCGDIQMDCEKFCRLIITSVSDIAVTVQQKMRTIAESSFDPQPKPCYT